LKDEEEIERGGHQDGHVETRFVFMVNRLYFGGIPLLLVLFPAGVDTSFVKRNRIVGAAASIVRLVIGGSVSTGNYWQWCNYTKEIGTGRFYPSPVGRRHSFDGRRRRRRTSQFHIVVVRNDDDDARP
jgi:hypothetical protein